MRGGVTDAGRTTEQTLKIELLSQWKLEAEFRNKSINDVSAVSTVAKSLINSHYLPRGAVSLLNNNSKGPLASPIGLWNVLDQV